MKPMFFSLRRIGLGLTLLCMIWASAGHAQSSPSFSVSITQPTNGATLVGPNVQINALTSDSADDVAYVSFVAGPAGGPGARPQYLIYLGAVSNSVPLAQPEAGRALYIFTWTNSVSGNWLLTATAFRSNGVEVSSAPVQFTITNNWQLAVSLTTPTNGSTFPTPTNIELIAEVGSVNDSAAFVQFFDGSQSLGVSSNWAVVDPIGPGPPPYSRAYFFNCTNQSLGSDVLSAAVTDTNGYSVFSAPVTITVGSNQPPTVRITSPANNALFRAPVNVALLAYAHDADGYVASVQFLAGAKNLGFGQPVEMPISIPFLPPGPPIPAPQSNIFELIWSNAPPGSYAITALATANNGAAATSSPVNLTIQAAVPPPTNLPALVGIIATDPIAIEGTNCWPWLGGPVTWSNWASPVAVWHWSTNCGPKDATFTVRRLCGDTNRNLTVNYAIGGTASNGIDYLSLPGNLTIPAGQEAASIPLVPVDNSASNFSSTVILTLTPSTNVVADYITGFPGRAEALIIDSNGIRSGPPGTFLADRSFHFSITGPDGAWFHIDYTTNLINWTPLCTNQVINGSIDFADPDAATSATRVYRTIPL